MNDTTKFRPADHDYLRSAVRRLFSSSAGADAIFAGMVVDDTLVITDLFGTSTRSLAGLQVRRTEGIGGSALHRRSGVAVADYLSSRNITHHHDHAVRHEGLMSIAAVPAVVNSETRAVIYAATRRRAELGGQTMSELQHGANAIAQEFTVRDEVDRRLDFVARTAEQVDPADRNLSEVVREVHADLLAVAAAMPDSDLSRRIYQVTESLSSAVNKEERESHPPRLTRREIDVIAHVALGCGYDEVGQRLGLAKTTVKSYMQAIHRKLGVRGRFEAVVAARRAGIIP